MANYLAVPPRTTGQQIEEDDWRRVVDNFSVHQSVTTIRPTNNTGVTVAAGYVGVLDDAVENSLVAHSFSGDTRRVVVVQDFSVANGQLAYCLILGHCDVAVQGAVGLHDLLETSSMPGYAQSGTEAPFAVALAAAPGPGAAVIRAVLLPASVAGASGYPIADPSATHGPWPFHLTGTAVNHLVVSPGAGLSIYVTRIRVMQNNSTASILSVNDTAGPTRVEQYPFGGVQGSGVRDTFNPPWKIGANEGLDVIQSASGDLYGSINGYVAAG